MAFEMPDIISTSPYLSNPVGHYKYASKGLLLGNLTGQLLVNIYMNKFDQFVKHRLKANYDV